MSSPLHLLLNRAVLCLYEQEHPTLPGLSPESVARYYTDEPYLGYGHPPFELEQGWDDLLEIAEERETAQALAKISSQAASRLAHRIDNQGTLERIVNFNHTTADDPTLIRETRAFLARGTDSLRREELRIAFMRTRLPEDSLLTLGDQVDMRLYTAVTALFYTHAANPGDADKRIPIGNSNTLAYLKWGLGTYFKIRALVN